MHAAWRDVHAAVHSASGLHSFAILEVLAPDSVTREYRLIGVRGERATVRCVATRLVENSLPSDPWIDCSVTLGATATPERAAALRESLDAYRPAYSR